MAKIVCKHKIFYCNKITLDSHYTDNIKAFITEMAKLGKNLSKLEREKVF